MGAQHERIADVLAYIGKVELASRKPAFAMDPDKIVGRHADLARLPGVELGEKGASERPWLAVDRLAKSSPPPLPDELEGWCALSESPAQAPQLASSKKARSEPGSPASDLLLADDPGISEAHARYLAERWEPWAASERPRRESIKLYHRLFALAQAMSGDAAGDPVELAWGMGIASWRKDGRTVDYPLLVQPCRVELDKASARMLVWPKDADPELDVERFAEMAIPRVRDVEAEWRGFKAACEAAGAELSPFDPLGSEPFLRRAAALLSESGHYLEAPASGPAGPELRVSPAWALFSREKAGHFLLADLELLGKAAMEMAERGAELPPAIAALVAEASAEHPQAKPLSFRGLSTPGGAAGCSELYFPLPYNEEQVRIVELLEQSAGVVVQGPPGTGKTHTIANVVSHYLAQGKRVLVTSKGETALSVVKGKLPAGIAPLCVALLTDDAEGARQFEQSISMIVNDVAKIDPQRVGQEVERIQARIEVLHSSLAAVDADLADLAAQQLAMRGEGGREGNLGDLARKVAAEAPELSWMEHGFSAASDPAGVSQADIDAWEAAKRRMGSDALAAGLALPDLAKLPTTERAREIRMGLEALAAAKAAARAAQAPGFAESGMPPGPGRLEAGEAALRSLERALSLREGLAGAMAGAAWLAGFERALAAGGEDAPAKALAKMVPEVSKLDAERSALLPWAVEAPQGLELDMDFKEALGRLAKGGKAAGLFSPGRKRMAEAAAACRAKGMAPDPSGWAAVARHLEMRRSARSACGAWSALAQEFSGPPVAFDAADPARCVKALAAQAAQARLAADSAAALAEANMALRALFGSGSSCGSGSPHAIARAKAGLELALAAERGMRWEEERAKCVAELSASQAEPAAAMLAEARGWGCQGGSPSGEAWGAGLRELARLAGLRPDWDLAHRVAAKAAAAGAPSWGAAMDAALPGSEAFEAMRAGGWLRAWRWRASSNMLSGLPGHGRLAELTARRLGLEDELASAYEDAVVKRTWLGVRANCAPLAQQKLQTYLNSIQAMGKGAGVRAQRHRRTAREAMAVGAKAISCWIMPHWRVSETMAAEVGMFDLVVVDEASQSDIWALPALMRGKKVLIVGDHKQVSPSAVGVKEEDLREMKARHLAGQPHGTEMTQDKSIYDLGRVAFASSAVMLREHFRCAPAIIEFSNRMFYNGQIKPLRAPSLAESKAAPLCDVLVRGGFRDSRDANPPEARAVVDEVKAMLADPAWAGKTIGVVALLGQFQSKLIASMLSEEVDPREIARREIRVGTAAEFQGRERDVMLISMVIQKGDQGMSGKADNEQRLNVAMSRARDRVVLFRSVGPEDVKAESLSGRLLAHFRQPFPGAGQGEGDPRSLCESPFELEVYDELAARGYRVLPQFPCGGFRIDFVVEGPDGRRVALECDGDRHHGPGAWIDDMRRQRVLERAGWVFWRCFASSFAMEREEVLSGLESFLAGHGVRPMRAGDGAPDAALVEFRTVSPMAEPSAKAA